MSHLIETEPLGGNGKVEREGRDKKPGSKKVYLSACLCVCAHPVYLYMCTVCVCIRGPVQCL